MMGDKDYKQVINGALDALAKESTPQITNPSNKNEVFLHEITRCMRRSYFDRFDSLEPEGKNFDVVLGGLIRKLPYGAKLGEFAIDEIKLKGQADMITEDIVIIFKTIKESPENPSASDILYLNGCMWIFNKTEGVIVYMTGDGKETSFALTREKRMFEEVIRRVRVFSNLIADKKTPILEPSSECSHCQYYERCYIKKHEEKQLSISELFGSKKK
ncbi:CRISPR-associated protein Cas4 [Candidatus Nitrosotenuis aquarius]|uniref:CRISPR-associated protein Cas4 n=1 Tax=Candidatus Nitrosotenuis aquarius TaxID=1846278 RepID=UPI000C1F20E1|nr:Dna2/Cas4 domain-containing protein [Candidatus Nitrosotenuis aquarius]